MRDEEEKQTTFERLRARPVVLTYVHFSEDCDKELLSFLSFFFFLYVLLLLLVV